MLDLAVAVVDPSVTSGQYRYVETHAWWLGSFGPHQYLAEHRLRQWVPAHPERDWLLERELTGAHTWLTGSAAAARADGFDLRGTAPIGRFRARHGAFHADADHAADTDSGDEHADGDAAAAADDDGWGTEPAGHCPAHARPQRGNWQSPTVEFFQRLPRDPQHLLERLVEDNPGTWFTPFAAAVTALRTGLVPAALRAVLYRALTGLPAVSVVEHMPNIDGQDCVALVHDAGRTRTELMIDPTTGQFAGERDTVRTDSRCGVPAGTVVCATAVRVAVVDRAGVRP